MIKAIRLAEDDNVATLLKDVAKGESVQIISDRNEPVMTVTVLQAITFGNKVAIKQIGQDDLMMKAGCAVGRAITDIPVGELVHVQNIRSLRLDIPEPIIQEIIRQMNIEVTA